MTKPKVSPAPQPEPTPKCCVECRTEGCDGTLNFCMCHEPAEQPSQPAGARKIDAFYDNWTMKTSPALDQLGSPSLMTTAEALLSRKGEGS